MSDLLSTLCGFSLRPLNEFGWTPGNRNSADVSTKLDSPLTKVLILNSVTGKLHIYFTDCETSHPENSYG